jgi:hypothetical protein
MSTATDSREALQQAWADAWPTALAVWSRYTRLRTPHLCLTSADARKEGLSGSFAMIRLDDQRVVIDLEQIEAYGLTDFAPEILAHEIGHHILAPATLTDHARMVARMRRALPTREADAGMIANLYTDLLINDRLQRSAELRMADVFKALPAASPSSRLWALYQRIYEHLWQLPKGALVADALDDATEGDAWLGARLVRSYAREWLEGAASFAALCLPYLLDNEDMADVLKALHDTASAAKGGWPGGLVTIEDDEDQPIVHPANDPRITGEDTSAAPATEHPVDPAEGVPRHAGQCREPFEYAEILKGCGINLSDHEIAIRYYRERALPHLVRFPSRPSVTQADPLPEGLDPWEPGDPLDQIDWMQSLLQSPTLIPGLTTVQRHWGQDSHVPPKRQPVDLDLYVDCSGSMPHPQYLTSYTTLAGAILCLSALRAGARVKVTLWSGKHQFTATEGFVQDEHAALAVLTDYFGGGTAFPIHLLRSTYERPRERPAHIVILSDDGVSTLYDTDEWGNDGFVVAETALRHAGGGGTLVLNLPWSLNEPLKQSYASDYWSQSQRAIRRARDEQGWAVYDVRDWDGMIEFARHFSKTHYAPPGESDAV